MCVWLALFCRATHIREEQTDHQQLSKKVQSRGEKQCNEVWKSPYFSESSSSKDYFLFLSQHYALFFLLFHVIIMKIYIPRIQHSQEGRIEHKLFIPPISKCRREVGRKARGTAARIILGQYFREPRDIRGTGTWPYPFPPHRLLLAKEHFPTSSRWDLTSHQSFPPTPTAPSSANRLLNPSYSSLQLSPCFSMRETIPLKKKGEST